MNFLEKNLEDIIYETDSKILNERGLHLFKNKKRQVTIGNYGVSDIICYEYGYERDPCKSFLNDNKDCSFCNGFECKRKTSLDIQILELKQNQINVNSFLQVLRYAKGILDYFNSIKFYVPFNIEMILIGSTLDNNSDFIYLPEIINVDEYASVNNNIPYTFDFNMFTYEYLFDGIYFNEVNKYSLINKGFKHRGIDNVR